MQISAFSAAKYIAERSGYSLSNLKIQKLLYLAHMLYLGKYGKPLLDKNFEAWDYGPVIPSLYHELKIYGANPVGNIFRKYENIQEGKQQKILTEACNILGKLSAGMLVKITHKPEGAWAKRYQKGTKGRIISNKDIQEEYKQWFGEND